MNCNFNPTTTVLASILPYPATTYDAILRRVWCVVAWQKYVLYCQGNPVYETRVKQHIPWFNVKKIVFSCLWNSLVFWLRQSATLLKSSRPWSPCSPHYSRAYTAHSVVYEVHASIMFEAFLSKYHETNRIRGTAGQPSIRRAHRCRMKHHKGACWHHPCSLISLPKGKGITIPVLWLLEHICF